MNNLLLSILPGSGWLTHSNEYWSQFNAPLGTTVALSSYIGQPFQFYSSLGVSLPSLYLLDRQPALYQLNSMDSLSDDWDGFGAASIPRQISQAASSFVLSLPVHIPTPEVSPNPNGTISLEWENDFGRAHLEIGKTQYSLYFRRSEGPPLYRNGFVNEIDLSKKQLLSAMYPVAATQDYTISNIRLAEAA